MSMNYDMQEIDLGSDGEEEDNMIDYGSAMPQPDANAEPPAPFEGDLRMGHLPPPPNLGETADNNIQALVTPLVNGMPRAQRRYNTGPKGVKADYEIAKQNLKAKRLREAVEVERKLRQQAFGAPPLYLKSEAQRSAAAAAQREASRKRDAYGLNEDHPDTDDEHDSDFDTDDDDDDEVFKQYKAQRMKAMASEIAAITFGSYDRVSVPQLAACISEANKNTITIVHMYENHVEACTRVHLAMERMAASFKYIQFLRIRATECISGFSDKGLPTFLVYRGQEKLDMIVAFTREVGAKFDDQEVVDFFDKRGLLSSAPPGMPKPEVAYSSLASAQAAAEAGAAAAPASSSSSASTSGAGAAGASSSVSSSSYGLAASAAVSSLSSSTASNTTDQ